MPCQVAAGGEAYTALYWASVVVFERESDFDGDLVLPDLAILDTAADLRRLEPAQVS
jgi:hypothetical protein